MPRKGKLECLLNVVHGYEGLDRGGGGGGGGWYSLYINILACYLSH